jgi:4-alpha-glucanotransferase
MADPLPQWLTERGAGVLLHPTSLPGAQGIGTFDGKLVRFLDFLKAAGIRYWQLCPLGPTGYGDSPYQCFSAFAGNPYLIDLQDLAGKGLATPAELAPLGQLSRDKVDYGALYRLKWPILRRAYDRFRKAGEPAWEIGPFSGFKAKQAGWLEAYATFQALKDHHKGRPWTEWPEALRTFGSAAKSPLLKKLEPEIDAHRFYQYLFSAQWARVRSAAASRGIAIIGDLPIFVAGDSADVWAHPELFELDPATGVPVAVAGVPPDYFSADGQLWGNPLYDWARHKADGYAWWRRRMAASFEVCDVVRIDHFRGFDEYWRIPLPATTARIGKWMPGPGIDFFHAIQRAFPGARIIAEDLGVLTPTVTRLRDESGLPGMAILQFAFGDKPTNPYLPHNLIPNSVVYPGTHDNDTTLGWYAKTDARTRDSVRKYLRVDGREVGWDFIRAAYASVSRMAIVPLQDLMSLGSEARFNTPAQPAGNWQWRYRDEQLEALFTGSAAYLNELAELYGRKPAPKA